MIINIYMYNNNIGTLRRVLSYFFFKRYVYSVSVHSIIVDIEHISAIRNIYILCLLAAVV